MYVSLNKANDTICSIKHMIHSFHTLSVPDPPTDVNCTTILDTIITLNWTEPSVPNGQIYVYTVTVMSSNEVVISVTNTTSNDTQYQVTGLDPGRCA